MYYLVTITKREYSEDFLQFLYENGAGPLTAALCEGTAQQKILDRLGIEKTEKTMLSSVVSEALAEKLLRGLTRTMRIDAPGSGIAFTVPLQSMANLGGLQQLAQRQKTEQEQVIKMEESRFSLVVVIAQKGHTELIMDAARSANAGGGTIVHAKGVGDRSGSHFFGISIASEQDMIYIISKKSDEKEIMRAIKEKAGSRQGPVEAIFSLPVNHVVGLRSVTDE